MRTTILGAASLLLMVYCQLLDVSSAQPDRPNFILIFADDLGFGDLGSYGHPYAVTPNIDRLATEGTLFRQFHVNGNVCPVTRAGLMTSRNPSWFPNYTDDYSFMGALTVTNLLQDAGYLTGHIGKWNIGVDPDTEHVEYGIDDLRITGSTPNDPRGREGLRFDVAIDFLEEHKDETFYLNLWIFAPHTPINPPQAFIDRFADVTVDRSLFGMNMQEKFDRFEQNGLDITEQMRIYLGEVYALDLQVGRLLDKLDELALAENTVVIFSSDNGPSKDYSMGYSGGLRGEKHSYYEGGTRVPFLVRWPEKVAAGRVDNESIMFGSDWLTTVCSLAGAEIPWDLVEGEDMSDVWLGASRSRTNPLFFRQLRARNHDKVHMRYGRWKLHKFERELYDLATDEEELVNLYDLRPDIVAAMLFSMEAWEATMPTDHARLPDDPLPFDPTVPVTDFVLPNIEGDSVGPLQPVSPPRAFTPQPAAAPTPAPIQVSSDSSIDTTRGNNNDGLPGGAIAGIIVTSIVGLGIVIGVAYYRNHKAPNKKAPRPLPLTGYCDLDEGSTAEGSPRGSDDEVLFPELHQSASLSFSQ